MSIKYDDSNRQAVPRCLPYATACSLQILRASRRAGEMGGTVLEDSDAERRWIEKPNLISAIDLVAEAMIVKDFSSKEAGKGAKYILSEAESWNSLAREVASHFLEARVSGWEATSETPDRGGYGGEIARLRRSVRDYPVNPVAWCDLSLSYAAIGLKDKAIEAMRVAIGLAKHNRFILRSASRCFMHFDDAERAVWILNKSGLCAIDPWIASAEIAISEAKGLKSKCIGKARDLVGNESLTPFARSELAAGLGTIEMKTGSVKRGKRIMRQAVIQPTENALAQVEWASSFFSVDFDDMIDLTKSVPASFEAEAVHAFYGKQFAESLNASEKWARFQFLSSRPIIHSTFVASCILDDDLRAVKIFEGALPAQKNDALAMNNYAFALARIGRTDEAAGTLEGCIYKASPEVRLAIGATTGLICFREGDTEGGRRRYHDAVSGFERLGHYRSAAIGKYYWAVEEKRIGSDDAKGRIEEAKKAIRQQNVFELEELAEKL